MPFDSDVALLGTGVAPLVAANHLLAQGKSVLLLNPDWDFFLEDSELPIDPLWPVGPESLSAARLLENAPESALAELRPDFPGAVEFWSGAAESAGFHDRGAPHVRQRSRLWITSDVKSWEALEDAYVENSDAGLNPQMLEGIQAARRFPGFAADAGGDGNFRGLLIPKSCDVDVSRYRNGLLEFVRERLGPERVVCEAAPIELMPDGVRFHAGGMPRTARLREGMLVFWTPRLSQWVISQAKKSEVTPVHPRGVRLWEEWSLLSREPIDPGLVGSFEGMSVWAEVEGPPSATGRQRDRLAVLRAGPLITGSAESNWASAESYGALSRLCHDFLHWDRFSIRSMRPRALFERGGEATWFLTHSDPKVHVVPGCDGPIVSVVKAARTACDRMEILGALR